MTVIILTSFRIKITTAFFHHQLVEPVQTIFEKIFCLKPRNLNITLIYTCVKTKDRLYKAHLLIKTAHEILY